MKRHLIERQHFQKRTIIFEAFHLMFGPSCFFRTLGIEKEVLLVTFECQLAIKTFAKPFDVLLHTCICCRKVGRSENLGGGGNL